jgi:MYXO-CTERM domain-containing protein
MLTSHSPGGQRHRAAFIALVVAGGVLTATRADAHFKLNAPACWLSQDNVGGPQKNGPCAAVANTGLGDVMGTPTNMVTAFTPGQTVSVSVTATIAHPGWWRIALVEGASSTQTLTTLPDPKAQAGTNCTPAIVMNPVWSPTQPVLADGLPAGSTANTQQSGTKTFQVTIPQNATCTTAKPCALQVIMVMTDHPANDCYYHHCADITTSGAADAGRPDSSGSGGDASVSKDAQSPGDGSSSGPGTGGSSGVGGSGNGGSSVGSGGEGGASTSGPGTGGSTTSTTGSTTSGPVGTGGSTVATGAGGAGPNGTTDTSGCSCILSSHGGTPAGVALTALLALAAARRRRRRFQL